MGPRIPECATHSLGSRWSLGCPSEYLSYFLPEHKLPLDLSPMAILQGSCGSDPLRMSL